MFYCEEKGSQGDLRRTGAASVPKKHPTISRKAVLTTVSFAMAKKAALIAIAMALATAGALAQMVPLSSDIMRPTPGAGHDYVKGLNETVNPANGSLSISIQLPTLPSRGITLPFSIIYNSGIVHHTTIEEYLWGTAARLTQDGADYIPTERSVNGWSDTLPYASVSSFDLTQSGTDYNVSCGISSSYAFYDASGQSFPLGISAISPATGSGYADQDYCFDQTGWSAVSFGGSDKYTANIVGGPCLGRASDASTPGCTSAAPGFTAADADGTIYTFNEGTYANVSSGSEATASTFPVPSTIEDRNGNFLSISGGQSNGSGYTPTIVTDTSGRTAEQINYNASGSEQIPQSYLVGGLTYSLSYTTTSATFCPGL